jgi:hypothetical protein
MSPQTEDALGNIPSTRYRPAMSTVKEIESAIQKLAPAEVKELANWIEDYLEDELQMTDEFKASIERGKKDIAASRTRTR